MKFYRVEYYEPKDGHVGFTWHASKEDAMRAVRDKLREDPAFVGHEPTVELKEIGLSKRALLHALNTYASHPDNG